jgi:steroid delta-isomerase-like uncharacterized protein
MIARRQSIPEIVDIPNCADDYPGVSTIYRWKGMSASHIMENMKYRTSAQQSKDHRKGESCMSAEESKDIVRRFWDVWEEGNIDLVDELLAPEYFNHTPASPDQPTGPESVKEVVSMFRSAMPDLKVVVEDMIAEGDKVAVRYMLEGTYEGELFGIPPTGRELSIKSISVERVSDGKVREHWRVTDSLDMMQQLGIVPEPEQEGVEASHYSGLQ